MYCTALVGTVAAVLALGAAALVGAVVVVLALSAAGLVGAVAVVFALGAAALVGACAVVLSLGFAALVDAVADPVGASICNRCHMTCMLRMTARTFQQHIVAHICPHDVITPFFL